MLLALRSDPRHSCTNTQAIKVQSTFKFWFQKQYLLQLWRKCALWHCAIKSRIKSDLSLISSCFYPCFRLPFVSCCLHSKYGQIVGPVCSWLQETAHKPGFILYYYCCCSTSVLYRPWTVHPNVCMTYNQRYLCKTGF